MLADLWDVTIIAAMLLVAATPFMLFTRFGLWVAERVQRILIVWQQWCIDRERQRMDVQLVTLQPGEIRVSRAELGAMMRAQIELTAQRTDALRLPANVPHTLHYAPHIKQVEGKPIELATVQPEVNVQPTDLWKLWHAGALPEHGYLLGHNLDTGAQVTADWQRMYNILVGGTPGSGKSTLVRSILAQSALQGGRFVVIDPHYGAGEESLGESLHPLRSLMLCDVASTDKQMVDALRYVLNIGRRRKDGDPDRTPLFLVVDETTALFQRSNIAKELEIVLGETVQERRKSAVYALCIGQNFSGSIMKTEVRNSFGSFFSCRARREVARVMSGNNEFAQAAEKLKVGQAVWMDTGGEMVRLAVPNCTQHHIELVARQCSPVVENGPKVVYTPETMTADKPLVNHLETTLKPNEMHALDLFRQGRQLKEIIVEAYDAETGKPYTDAVKEFMALIRKKMQEAQP